MSEIHKYGTNDGWHGVIAPGTQFPPEPNRYHMYIGLFCPFAHRANLIRHLCNLISHLPVSVVRPYPKGEAGWRFVSNSPTSTTGTGDEAGPNAAYPAATPDALHGSLYMHQLYFRDDPAYKGVYSVPLIWDAVAGRIVSNESAEMVEWLAGAFAGVSGIRELDLVPGGLKAEVEAARGWLMRDVCWGVYEAGFSATQGGYEAGVARVFAGLNRLEALVHAHGGPYVLGAQMTALDVLAYPTVVRFDAVYVQHFKANLGTIRHDYPVLNNWLKGLYWHVEGFRETTDFRHIKENYTKCHKEINPLGITPLGPYPDIEEGFERDWSKLKPGKVTHPLVLEAESQL